MSDLDTTIQYYQDLLIDQYANKSKARATIAALVGAALCDLLPVQIAQAFDLDTAIGTQLDMLGIYIGFNRRILVVITRDFFQFDDYTTEITDANGMTDYADPAVNVSAVFYRYIFNQKTGYDLQDEEYRQLLKLKRALNNGNNTLYSIQDIITTYFGTDVMYYDMANMTLEYTVSGSASYITSLAIQENLLPRPMGVALVLRT